MQNYSLRHTRRIIPTQKASRQAVKVLRDYAEWVVFRAAKQALYDKRRAKNTLTFRDLEKILPESFLETQTDTELVTHPKILDNKNNQNKKKNHIAVAGVKSIW